MSDVFAVFTVVNDAEVLMPQHVYANKFLANQAKKILTEKYNFSESELKVKPLRVNRKTEVEKKEELLRRIEQLKTKALHDEVTEEDRAFFCAFLLDTSLGELEGEEILLKTGRAWIDGTIQLLSQGE